MRFVALVAIILFIPIFVFLIRQGAAARKYFYISLGIMPFVIDALNLDAAIISWAMWPGYVKGISLSLLDAAAIAILIANRRTFASVPFRSIIIAYIVAASLSIIFSGEPQASLFYVWQLCRMFIVFLAVTCVCKNEKGPQLIIAGIILGVSFQAGHTIYEKLTGAIQATGTLGHQNLLGMVTHFALYPSLALLLSKGRNKLAVVGVAASLIVVILGASRATIGLAGFGIVLLLAMSMIRKTTAAKVKMAFLGILMFAVAAPLAIDSLQQRFTEKPIAGSYDERAAFESAAKMIISEHPMGVGANRYVVVASTEGYSERAGVAWNFGSRSANVHNTYLLVAAETGYLGLFCFILFLLWPIITALRYAWSDRRDPRGEVALGLVVTMIVVALHCFYEWIWVTYVVQYMVGISYGIMAGLILQRRSERAARLLANRSDHSHEDDKYEITEKDKALRV